MYWEISLLCVGCDGWVFLEGVFKFAGYLQVSNIQHFKYIREEDRLEKEHEILVQSVKKPNLPTS